MMSCFVRVHLCYSVGCKEPDGVRTRPAFAWVSQRSSLKGRCYAVRDFTSAGGGGGAWLYRQAA